MTNQEKISYLLTFNVNIYAETRGNQPEQIYDHEGCSVIQYMKGETLEISEESFMLFIEHGGMVNNTSTPITGIPSRAHFTAACIDTVAKKTEWVQIHKFCTTTKRNSGITAWSESFQAARMVDEFNDDSFRQDQWLKQEAELKAEMEIECSKELDMAMANESENIQ